MSYSTEKEQNRIKRRFMEDSEHLVHLDHIEENGFYGEKTVISAAAYTNKTGKNSNLNNSEYALGNTSHKGIVKAVKSSSREKWNTTMAGIEAAYEPYLFQNEEDAKADFYHNQSLYNQSNYYENGGQSSESDSLYGEGFSDLDYINSGIEIPIANNPVFFEPIREFDSQTDAGIVNDSKGTDSEGIFHEAGNQMSQSEENHTSKPLTFQEVLEMSEKSGVQTGIKNELNSGLNLNPDLMSDEFNNDRISSLNENLSYDVLPDNYPEELPIIDDNYYFDDSHYFSDTLNNQEDVEVVPIVGTMATTYATEGLGIDDSIENREHLQDLFYEKYPSADEIQFGDKEEADSMPLVDMDCWTEPVEESQLPLSGETFVSSADNSQVSDIIPEQSDNLLQEKEPYEKVSYEKEPSKEVSYEEEPYEEEYGYFEDDQLPYYDVEEPVLVEPEYAMAEEGPYIADSGNMNEGDYSYKTNIVYAEADYSQDEDQSYIENIPLQEEEEPKKKSRLFVPILISVIVLLLLLLAIAFLYFSKSGDFDFINKIREKIGATSVNSEKERNGYEKLSQECLTREIKDITGITVGFIKSSGHSFCLEKPLPVSQSVIDQYGEDL